MAKYDLNYQVLDEERKKKQNSSSQEFLDWVETIIFSFFIVILIFTFLLRIAYVDGNSMLPTLKNEDKLIVTHLFYTPKVGDIVIVNSEGLGKRIVKRVIATEGQTVDIDFATGTVTVDGKVLEEAYINNLTQRDEGGHQYPVTVPDGCIFVLGDNRMDSTDSRSSIVGFVPVEDVLGKVFLRIYPFDSIGTF
jgi:signal peptidase I